jgi:hypothetical protein
VRRSVARSEFPSTSAASTQSRAESERTFIARCLSPAGAAPWPVSA